MESFVKKTDRIETRQSNIELLRIVLMILVIAHHYVVNSGVMECFTYGTLSANMYYLQCFGAFGKIAINCFVLITGYFMINSKWSLKKWLMLYLEVKFYTLLIYLIFVASGYQSFNYHECLETVFSTLFGVGKVYAETFLALYLLIPFINILVNNMGKKQYLMLLGLLFVLLTIIPTFSVFISVLRTSNDTWNYLIWMVFLYLIGAFIRKNEHFLDNRFTKKLTLLFLAVNLILIFGWIALYDVWASKHDITNGYWFINNANKLLALTCAVAIFYVFKNIRIKHSRFINTVSATTFGVFLIHSSGDSMRALLWGDLINCVGHYNDRYIVLYSIFSVTAVFAVCSLIDLARIKLLEKPLFSLIDKKFAKAQEARDV